MVSLHAGLTFFFILHLCHYSEYANTARKHAKGNDFKTICYYGSWAGYPGRSAAAKLQADEIDPFVCSHIVYAFAKVSSDYNLESFDETNDLPNGRDGYGKLNSLKKKNPQLQTMLGVGGWTAGSKIFSQMSATRSSRKTFIKSAIEFLRKYNFDGLDLDWEYPTQRDGSSLDRDSFSDLCKDLRDAFDNEKSSGKKKLSLSAAVSGVKSIVESAYDISEISQYLDFINIISYDYHGGWERIAEHHSPLYGRSGLTNGQETLNVDWSVHYWLSHGCPAEKIIVGIPLYGRTFTLADASATDFGSAASGAGAAGPYTGEPGILAYFEICDKLLGSRWKTKIHPEHQVPYATSGNFWLGYDDEKSVQKKAQYIKDLGLGGAMLWSIEQDDFKGECSDGKSTYPLIRAVNLVLQEDNAIVIKPQKSKTTTYHQKLQVDDNDDDYTDNGEQEYVQPVKKIKSKKKKNKIQESIVQEPESTKLSKQMLPAEDKEDYEEIPYNEPKKSRDNNWNDDDTDLSFDKSTRPMPAITRHTSYTVFDLDKLEDDDVKVKIKTPKEKAQFSDDEEELPKSQKKNKYEEEESPKSHKKTKYEDEDDYKEEPPAKPSNDYKCLREGVFADRKNCSIFYRCIRDPMSDNFEALSAYEEVCPGGLLFDVGLSICNWPDNTNSC